MDRSTFLKALGPLPHKSPLKLEIISTKDMGAYSELLVSYDVEQGERVSAFVLIPHDIESAVPGVLCHHQHASMYNKAKSEMVGHFGDPDLAYAMELAQRGYVTIAPDALPFEDRNWNGEAWWGAEYFEMATRLLRGETLLAKVLSDLSKAIDCLNAFPEVDSSKIGFIGHSYGARMAIWAPAFDRRIGASVSNCFAVNFRNSLSRSSGTRIPMELCLPGFLELGDVEDVMRLAAPCPLYLSVAEEDKWSRDAQIMYDYAVSAFANSELRLKIWPGGHSFGPDMRAAAYSFLDEKLCAQ